MNPCIGVLIVCGQVHMPIDRETKKPRGMAFVTFMLPENAAKALTALDGSIFQVCLTPALLRAQRKLTLLL